MKVSKKVIMIAEDLATVFVKQSRMSAQSPWHSQIANLGWTCEFVHSTIKKHTSSSARLAIEEC
jgi:hypothetical protein